MRPQPGLAPAGPKDRWPAVAETVALEHELVAAACERLKGQATVEILKFDLALARVQDLLGRV